MGIYDRDYYRDEETRSGSLALPKSTVGQLILANVVIYVADMLVQGQLSDLLSTRSGQLQQPWLWWRFVTYGFAHDPSTIMHILFNMLGLLFFGREIEAIYGPRVFLRMYLTALVVGSVFWVAAETFAPLPGPAGAAKLIGASGAVTATIILFVAHFPRRTLYINFFIPVPAWLCGIFIVGSDLMGATGRGAGGVAYSVHLTGAAYGLLFYKYRWDLGALLPARLIDFVQRRFGRSAARSNPRLRVRHPDEDHHHEDGLVDAILDKLHREGEGSLTRSERRILEDYSRRLRERRGM